MNERKVIPPISLDQITNDKKRKGRVSTKKIKVEDCAIEDKNVRL